ncbi:MAG: hypothetical protein CMF31_07335 [Kordiimonas sp.]|nr:hypothetical protein [Kordiimonas sp.]|tara:strand:+ start:1141 stop:2169 length:1029 start_codon:yes stop_codon:yes gene_type:complete
MSSPYTSYVPKASMLSLSCASVVLRVICLVIVSLGLWSTKQIPVLAAPIASPPLADKIWHVPSQSFVTFSQMVQVMQKADIILLGEIHDNPQHHLRQARILKQFSRGREIAVLFEMVSRDYDNAFHIYRQRFPTSQPPDRADGLDMLLKWNENGWPDWSLYEPVFRQALQKDMSLFGAGLPVGVIASLHKEGRAGLSPALHNALTPYLQRTLPPALSARQRQDIARGHCDLLPAALLPRFSDIQTIRNAAFAQRIETIGPDSKKRILITGNEHARRDLGVVHYLSSQQKVISMGQIPVQLGHDNPTDYTARYGRQRLPFDFVWFSPSQNRTMDPCAGLRDKW